MEADYRLLAEYSTDVIARHARDSAFRYVSPAVRRILGYEPEELLGRSPLEFVHPDDYPNAVLAHQGTVDKTNVDRAFTFRFRRKDGSYTWLEVSGRAIRDPVSNEITELVTISRDVSARIAIQQRLRNSDARLAKMADNLPGMVYQLVTRAGEEPRFTYVSSWARSALGLDPVALERSHQPLVDLIHPDDLSSFVESGARARERMEPWIWQGRFLPRPGESIHVVSHSLPEAQPDDSVLWSGVLLDETERHRAQEALRESEERFRVVVDNMDIALIRSDMTGRVVLVNPAAVRMLGYGSPEQLLGKSMPLEVWGAPEQRPEVIATVLRDGVSPVLCPLKRNDGSLCMVQGALRVVRDRNGEPVAFDGVIRDVTDELRFKEEMVRAREDAEAANRAKTSFLANMSHEIRTPMNAILGLSHLALEASPPPKQREYLSQIRGAARALLDIINDVLDVSKIEAGKLTLESDRFELDRVLDSVANVISVRSAEKGLEVAFVVAPDVPYVLTGDRLRLGQVLINLAGNAVKFTERGEIALAVSVKSREAERVRLKFSVRDTGVGMNEAEIRRLFLPFSQADSSTTRKYGGTGLGLAISRELVRLIGGEIEVVSTPGVGSTFSFVADLGFSTDETPGAPSTRPLPELRGVRALVIDDSAISRDALSTNLSALGLTVSSVSSGRAALTVFEQAEITNTPYRLMLLDTTLPDLDAVEVAARIANGSSAPPSIIMLAPRDRDESADGGLELAGHTVVQKPVTRSMLLDALAKVLQLKRIRPYERNSANSTISGLLKGTRLLVVEDNEVNQLIAREVLEGAGASVVVAEDGHHAIPMAIEAEPPFDAILMDVQMPAMDGHEAARALRANPRTRQVPIIAMTAHAFEAERQKCLESGMNDYLAKPIDPPQVVAKVARWTKARVLSEPAVAEVPVTAQSTSPVDPEALRSVLGDDPVRFAMLLNKFIASARSTLELAKGAWAKREALEIAFAGHKLKSSARACGAHALADACEALERAAKNADWDALDSLEGEAERLLDDVARYAEALPK